MKISRVKDLITAPSDAVAYYITSTVASIRADEHGSPINPDQTIEISEWKREGKAAAVKSSDLALGIWVVTKGEKFALGRNVAPTTYITADRADGCDSILAELTDRDGSIVYSLSIPLEWQGSTGNNGKDGVSYEILPSVANIRADNYGTILTGAIQVSAYKIEGETRKTCRVGFVTGLDGESYYWIQYKVDNESWTNCNNISIGSGMVQTMGYGVPASAVSTTKTGIAFRLLYGTSSTSNTVVHETAQIQVVKDGQAGENGKSGRFYYYDGFFVSNKEYKATDHQAPYVAFDWTDRQTVNGKETDVIRTSYYMLVADTNKSGNTYIAPRTTAATGVWELMETSFKYIIAQAFFSDFAKLGSAVFSGDWMISQHGKINGVASADYFKFDDDDPTGAISGNFAPNYAVDLLTGKVYLNDAYIRGVVYASKGEFSGIVNTSLMYSRNRFVDAKTLNIDPVNDPAYMYIASLLDSCECILPKAASYDGLELRFFVPATNMRTTMSLAIKTSGNDVIRYSQQYGSSSSIWLQAASTYTIQPGIVTTVKSMDGAWQVISGDNYGHTGEVTISGKTLQFYNGILLGSN